MKSDPQQELTSDIRALLRRLRMRIRLYVWVEGVATVVSVLGIAFWLGLAVDWIFEPPVPMRFLVLTAVMGVALFVLYRSVLNRAFARLADSSMAVLLERNFEQFHDSLLTTVELAEPATLSTTSRDLLEHTRQHATDRVRQVRLGNVFNAAPIVRVATVASVLLVSIVLFGMMATDAFGFWIQRLMLSDELWPRHTRLVVDGFRDAQTGERTEKVARGSEYKLIVKADATREVPPPQNVEVRYRSSDGTRGRARMTRIGQAIPGRDPYQLYRYAFKDVSVSLTFDVVGGDDRVTNLKLQVVERPQIVEMRIECEYPDYLQRQPRTLSVTGVMRIPEGTAVTVGAQVSKDIQHAEVQRLDQPSAAETVVLAPVSPREIAMTLPTLHDDQLLGISLLDQDGIRTSQPYRLSFRVIKDEVPQVAVALKGIGTSITPDARIPIIGKVSDDYGVRRVWFEYHVEDGPLQLQDFQANPDGQTEYLARQTLDARAFDRSRRLKPQQKLLLLVRAADRYDLADQPNLGTSQQFLLDVVTPDRLQADLEKRELWLRRRFVVIHDNMIGTRDLMARIESTDTNTESPQTDEQTAKQIIEKSTSGDGSEATQPNPLRSDKGAAQLDERSQRAQANRQLRVVRSVQNVERAAHETLEVARAFEEIREELVNNRIDTDAIKQRLTEGISDPLNHIGTVMLPDLKEHLQALEQKVSRAESYQADLQAAILEADRVLVEMKRVLDKMLELESYHEVLELLRSIIQDQGNVNDATREERKKFLRSLLED